MWTWVHSHLLSSISFLLAVPEQHSHSQSGLEVSGSYFVERDYRPLLLGGTRPPGPNSSVTWPPRRRKQVNRHSSDICCWVTFHNLLSRSAASKWWPHYSPKPFNCPPFHSYTLPLLSVTPNISSHTLTNVPLDSSVTGYMRTHLHTCSTSNPPLQSPPLMAADFFQFGGPLLMESGDRFGSPVVAQCSCVMKSLLSYKSQV